MAVKRELQIWAQALEVYDAGDLPTALTLFRDIATSSKVLYNMAAILSQEGDESQAIGFYERASELDPFLAVAFFQAGISCYRTERYNQAKRYFSNAFINLRGNSVIDYEQLGLKFRLFACEVLFNRALASMKLGLFDEASVDMKAALARKAAPHHSVIDNALRDIASRHDLFVVPLGLLFRPADIKMKNLDTRDYLGKPKLIAAASLDDAYTSLEKPIRQTSKLSKDKGERATRPRRSNTTGALLEKTFDGVAKPLVWSDNFVVDSGPKQIDQPPKSPTRLGRSQTVGAATAPFARLKADASLGERFMAGSSTLQAAPDVESLYTAPSPIGETIYVGAQFVDDYLRDEPKPMPSVQPLATVKRVRSRTSSDKSTPGSQGLATGANSPPLLSRVATWARHRANASLGNLSSTSKNLTSNDDSRAAASPASDSPAGSNVAKRDSLTSITEHLASLISTPDTSAAVDSSVLVKCVGVSNAKERVLQSDQIQVKIRVKVRYLNEVRALIVSDASSIVDFRERLRAKFSLPASSFSLKYKDPDAVLVSLVDQDDWECALEEASESSKLEIFID
ncbi:hypothetical protein ACM66B_000754 [Microbotryomycetes sp. NB124-2]